MTGLQTVVPVMLAAGNGENEVPNFPLFYQITCAVLVAIFVWTFSIARDPRGWRRLYQAMFTKEEDLTVTRNKVIDENMKKYGIRVAMIFLVAAVTAFLLGITYQQRHTQGPTTQDDKFRAQDTQRILDNAHKDAVRRSGDR